MRFLFQLQHRPGALELDPYAALYAFQCENPRTACNRWSPSSGANAVIPVKLAKPSLVGGPASPRPYPEYRLTWAAALEASEALTVDVNRASAAELEALEKAREEAPDTKVGGVPVWLQSPSKMECHGQPMRFIAQVNAEPFSLDFGDDGRGYIFRCTHPEHGGFQFLVESA